MGTIKIEIPRDTLGELIDFIRESPDAPGELYDESALWELAAFGEEDLCE